MGLRIMLYPGPGERWWVHLHEGQRGLRHYLDLDPCPVAEVQEAANKYLLSKGLRVRWRQIDRGHPQVYVGELTAIATAGNVRQIPTRDRWFEAAHSE